MSYKFKVGDKGKTRGGRAYRVICDDRKWTRPANGPTVIALIDPGTITLSGEELCNYDQYGKCRFSDQYDLLPPTVTKWLNVWRRDSDGSVGSALCNEEADAKRKAAVAFKGTTYLIIAQPVEVQES